MKHLVAGIPPATSCCQCLLPEKGIQLEMNYVHFTIQNRVQGKAQKQMGCAIYTMCQDQPLLKINQIL